MTYSATVYRVLIASPGDVPKERLRVVEAIQWWNASHSDARGILLQPVMWELDAAPEMGGDPQQLLNMQMVPKCDILIAIFWSRLGTPTPRAQSGTVEEITVFVEARKPALIYFSRKDVPQSLLADPGQYIRLQEFKKQSQNWGVYQEFDTDEALLRLVQHHLSLTIDRLQNGQQVSSAANRRTSDHTAAVLPVLDRVGAEADALRGAPIPSAESALEPAETENPDDLGVLDFSEKAVGAMERLVVGAHDIRSAIDSVGVQMRHHAARIDAAVAAGQTTDPSHSKKLINAAATDLEAFGSTLLDKSERMGTDYAVFVDAIRRVLEFATESGITERDHVDLVNLRGVTSSLRTVFNDTRTTMGELRSTITRLPRMTAASNKAKRTATAALDETDNQLGNMVRLTDDLNGALDSFLAQRPSNTDA